MAKKTKKGSLTPLGVHILISILPPNNEWVLSGKSKEKPDRGIVEAVGEDIESEVLRDSIGKMVVFRQYAQERYEIGDQELFLLEESDIMGIWNE